MTSLHVNLVGRGYDIALSNGQLGDIGSWVRVRVSGGLAFLVTDSNVNKHAQEVGDALAVVGFRVCTVVLPPGETQKSLAAATLLYDRLAELQADRKALVVAVGGGVVGDLAGFVAATFNRGLPLLMVPTTLLAMVDSSVGGKVGVNHPRAKNLIGAFHQPVGVWIDTSFLGSLPDREYCSGLAEVVKYGVILDAEFFKYLEAQAQAILNRDAETVGQIVGRCCRLKADVVEKDEREETGLRVVLNYGHTFAHAFENAAGYGTWSHGEAVAAGMICASLLAERQGLIGADVTQRQEQLLEEFGLPTRPGNWPVEQLIATMRNDKKSSAGKMRFVLPKRLGEVALFDHVSEADVRSVLESFPPRR